MKKIMEIIINSILEVSIISVMGITMGIVAGITVSCITSLFIIHRLPSKEIILLIIYIDIPLCIIMMYYQLSLKYFIQKLKITMKRRYSNRKDALE